MNRRLIAHSVLLSVFSYVAVLPTFAQESVTKRLRRPIQVEFHKESLSNALSTVFGTANVSWRVDGEILQHVVDADPVTIRLAQPISCRSVMALVLEANELGFIIYDDHVRVTTREVAGARVVTRRHEVDDLLNDVPIDRLLRHLAELCRRWPTDSAEFRFADGSLVVTHQFRVHYEIIDELERIRRGIVKVEHR